MNRGTTSAKEVSFIVDFPSRMSSHSQDLLALACLLLFF